MHVDALVPQDDQCDLQQNHRNRPFIHQCFNIATIGGRLVSRRCMKAEMMKATEQRPGFRMPDRQRKVVEPVNLDPRSSIRHLSNPGNGSQGVHQKLPLGDVVPSHCPAIQHNLFLCAILADEADMEVYEQLRKVKSACSHPPHQPAFMWLASLVPFQSRGNRNFALWM